LDDGSTVLFWEDLLWAPIILADAYPRLFSFASNTQLLVKDGFGFHPKPAIVTGSL